MLIGYCFTGSFCTLEASLVAMENLINQGHDVIPIFSYNVRDKDTRFFKAAAFRERVSQLCAREIIDDIVTAEPLGPIIKCDIMCVIPCTSNTLAKLRFGITDTPVTMAVKAHVRNNKPVVIGMCTNDGFGVSASNFGALLTRGNYYFVPTYQDNIYAKPRSLVTDIDKISETINLATQGIQIQPIITKK